MKKEEAWETAEVVSGRLVEIDKESSRIGIEIKEYDETEKLAWALHYYDVSEDFSDEDYKKLLNDLDSYVKAKLLDGEITEISIM